MLERDRGHPAVTVEEGPANLRVAGVHHPRWTPIVYDVGIDIGIHPQGIRLTNQQRPPTRVHVPNVEGRLAFVDAGAVEVELELRLIGLAPDIAGRLGAQPRLPHAEDRLAVAAECA